MYVCDQSSVESILGKCKLLIIMDCIMDDAHNDLSMHVVVCGLRWVINWIARLID